MLTVSKDGKGDYKTIVEAIQSIAADNASPLTIFVREGVYTEKLILNRPYLSIVGEARDKTVICYADYARRTLEQGEFLGTFGTATLMVDTHDILLKNLTIQNAAGPGYLVGQAIALYLDGDHIEVNNCRILGNQDTVFTAPLPPEPLESGGFKGPKEFAPRVKGRHYFKDCYVEGDVDFIFGSASVFFHNCEIFSINNGDREHSDHTFGYITAPSTPFGQEYGYVFYQCRFTGNCPPDSVYLGRPWRNYGKAVLINCYLGVHIKEEGWWDWNKAKARETVFFAEFGNYGEGTKEIQESKRVPWSRQLKETDLYLYTKEAVYYGENQ